MRNRIFFFLANKIKWFYWKNNQYLLIHKKIFLFFSYIFHLYSKRIGHHLPNQLIVSLTSYKPRFETLFFTIKCLINQSILPDKVILWVAPSDFSFLPENVIQLQSTLFEIKIWKDIKQYKKIIPTLHYFPNCFIVPADDDLLYSYRWLEVLIKHYAGNNNEVLCYRAHKVRLENFVLQPYKTWKNENPHVYLSHLLFPTSGAGVLFPPGVFFKDVLNENLFLKLAPTSDDIWLWWMSRLNGVIFRTIVNSNTKLLTTRSNDIIFLAKLLTGLNSQKIIETKSNMKTALWYENNFLGGNDVQMKRMVDYYGINVFKLD